jgi:hypothetical protein
MPEKPRFDQLRQKIDAEEKVPVFDPAAAPLGTDAEAGGLKAIAEEPPASPSGHAPIAARSGSPGATTVFVASFAATLAICAGLFLAMLF